MKVTRSNSVSSEDAPSSPESLMDVSPQPSPGPHSDPAFEEEEEEAPQYSPAYRPDDKEGSYSSHYDYHPQASHYDDDDDTFGCQEQFLQAVRNGDPRHLTRILTRYSQLIQINRMTTDGQTALTQSILDGNLEVVKVLLAHGANSQLTNRDGFSPLHVACFAGKMDLITFFLTSGNNNGR